MRIVKFLYICTLLFSSFVQCMMRDMAVMMGAQVGASVANQAVNATFSDMSTALTKSNSNITSAINDFTTDIKAANAKELKLSFQLFSMAQTNVQNLLTQQQASMAQMASYIQSAISLQQPQSNFLTTPATYDQFFTLATMYTPQGALWKNPFPVGNWEYDETTDSFWQMSNSSFLPDKAANNSIFTEWFARTSSYTIECEITLYQVTYPFFAGLIFNKARWISGDTPRIQKYRLLGLYGNQNQTAQLCFAEPKNKPATSANTTATLIYPLEQIVAGKGAQKIPFDATWLQNLTINPLVFRLKIIASSTNIQYKFWLPPAAEPATFFKIKSNDPDLYLYHGIGFMAPGALAEFKLIQPKSLLFSLDAQKTFTAQVQSFIQKQIVQQTTKTIDQLVTKQTASLKGG